MEIKFSKIGTLGPTPSPSLNEIGEFFKKQLVDKVKNWFNNNIKWKTFTLKLPTGITWAVLLPFPSTVLIWDLRSPSPCLPVSVGLCFSPRIYLFVCLASVYVSRVSCLRMNVWLKLLVAGLLGPVSCGAK